MDLPVQITEKLEGTNFAAVREPDGEIYYCMRGHRIQELEDADKPNLYCETARRAGVPVFLNWLIARFPGSRLVLRGELIGFKVQGNIYKLKDTTIRFFDLKVDHKYLSARQFRVLVPENQTVPLIARAATLREWLDGRTIQEASNGMSLLTMGVRREGVVIVPLDECMAEFDGYKHRCIIKQRSPEYLAREKS